MATSFLDKTGLSYFWEKIKAYVDDKVSESSGSSATLKTVTLSSTGWTQNEQVVSAPGILADETKQLIQPVAASTSKVAYDECGISCIKQAADSLTFSCGSVPDSDLTVYVIVTELVTS